MENKNLLLEINEIKKQMGLLVESPIPVSLISNLFKKFAKGSIDDTFKKFFPRVKSVTDEAKIKNILSKIKGGGDNISNTLRNLSKDELSLVLRSLNPTKAAKLMFDEGLLFKTESIDGLIKSDIDKILNQGIAFEDVIAKYRDNIPTAFGLYKKIPITDSGFLEILEEYVSLYEKRLKSKLPKTKNYAKVKAAKARANDIIQTRLKNSITFKRLIINTFKSKVKIEEEITSIIKELDRAVSKGNKSEISTLTKKWTDYLSSLMPKLEGTTKEIADMYYKDLPINVKREIKRYEFYKIFQERAKLSGKELERALKNPWYKIVTSAPKGSSKISKIFLYPTKELAKRLGAIIVRNSASKMEEIILLLMNKKEFWGIGQYALSKLLTSALTAGALFPIMKTALTGLSVYHLPTVSKFFGIEPPDKTFDIVLLDSIREGLSKIHIKGFTNLDVIIPPIMSKVGKFIEFIRKTPMSEYGESDEDALKNTKETAKKAEEIAKKAKESAKNVVKSNQIIKNAEIIHGGDLYDSNRTKEIRNEISDLGYNNESRRVYVIDDIVMYVTEKGENIGDYHELFNETSTGKLNYKVNNKKIYLKKDDEIETNNSQTTTNESPEQRWLSEHSNGSFKKLNPNKPTTWLYYTEPNNQGDRYIYKVTRDGKKNQFIKK